MAFPFPDDRLALSRLNWCRRGSKTDYDGLSCILRARMCSAHIEASENPDWGRMSAGAFGELLSAAQVNQWDACPEGSVTGVCGMLLTERYAAPLWQVFGHQREERAYESINTGTQLIMPTSAATQLPDCSYPRDSIG